MSGILDFIPIQSVSAQTLDAVSQPTFGPIDVGDGGETQTSINLSADKTSVEVGETFTVTVNLKTNDIPINEYRIYINFDSTSLSVVDVDPDTTGTQVELLDTIFVIEDPEQNNNVNLQNGEIELIAKTETGNAFSVNRDVVEIQFQAQSTGVTTLSFIEGVSGTQLIRQSGTSVTYLPNELTIRVESSATSSSSSSAASSSSVSSGSGSSISDGGNIPGQTPDTAIINSDLAPFFTLGLGFVLVVLGVSISLRRPNREKKKK
jgi:hypothetical protein